MSELLFTEDGWEDYVYWQREDRKTLKKINDLLKAVSREPFSGDGKPEPLKGEKGKWSRRINEKDRLVYAFRDGTVTVYQCRGHYTDK